MIQTIQLKLSLTALASIDLDHLSDEALELMDQLTYAMDLAQGEPFILEVNHPEKAEPETLDVCSKCGGQNVQVAVWADANTGETFDDYGSWDETDTKWCVDCGAHHLLVPQSEYVESKTDPMAYDPGYRDDYEED